MVEPWRVDVFICWLWVSSGSGVSERRVAAFGSVSDHLKESNTEPEGHDSGTKHRLDL